MYPTVHQATYEMRAKEVEFSYELRRARQTDRQFGYRLNQLIERIRKYFKTTQLPLDSHMEAKWGF